ncbi:MULTISPECIES: DUF1285 domain-containing protein [unclassified Modicisalibacter]|uniref:DUF1285 domain-containing protein n=1 Tax=unclassified Modicisalibacter TaxID=2679913 RepID=UPI001CCA0143|nr:MULTISPECIES: DUF1285 domain-containing protein [unclassified Modicisalibacter]MBZ9556568.1 DUF1285 domain-containing protein [Modicisalibacter sp. R2A 31.J]MBZ9574963.1 DUF1285 domain-containing protein [Modicisalibacter sp. MOD 31.J]
MMLEGLVTGIEPSGASLPGSVPPVDRWSPPLSGDLDLTIGADGRWWHEGAILSRPRLVRLLATILRREDDGEYYLVTPVEKWRIRVEDRPLLVVDAECSHERERPCWRMTTQFGDVLALGSEHRLVLSATPEGAWVPEVAVRFGLAARVHRNVYYRLIEQAETREVDAGLELGLVSDGVWQPLGRLDREPS